MAKRTSSFRSNGIRNLKSSGSTAVKFTGRAASKAAVGLFKYAATDHLDMQGAYERIPSGIGVVETLWQILIQFFIRMVAIGITAIIFLVVIVFLASLS